MSLNLEIEDVRDYLIELAKRGETCGYKELADDIAGEGFYVIGTNHGGYVARIGGVVSENEAKDGRPLLSVLIVNQGTKLPGKGFFKLARDLGLFHGDVEKRSDRKAFAKAETDRVYKRWTSDINDADLAEIKNLSKQYKKAKAPEEKERLVKVLERGSAAIKVKAQNENKCQVCEAMGLEGIGFLKKDGTPYIEAHHVIPVSSRKQDVLSERNIITVCANHHRQLHYGNVKVLSEPGDDEFLFEIDGQEIKIAKVKLKDGRIMNAQV